MKSIITIALLVLIPSIIFSVEKKAEKELPALALVIGIAAGDFAILNEQDLVRPIDWKGINSKVFTITEFNKELDTEIKFERNLSYYIVPNPNSSYVVTSDVGDMKDLKVFVNWKGVPLAVERSPTVPDEAKTITFNRLQFFWKGMRDYKDVAPTGKPRPSSFPFNDATLKVKLGGNGPNKELGGSISFKVVAYKVG